MKAMLQKSCKTPEEFRVDFRSSKIQPGETYQQFSSQFGCKFEQWLESFNIDSTYSALRNFMIFNRFLSSLTQDLCIFIKEPGVRSFEQAVQLVDDWSSAHNIYAKFSHPLPSDKHKNIEQTTADVGLHVTKGFASGVRFHTCGEEGHGHSRSPQNSSRLQVRYFICRVGFCFENRKVYKDCVLRTNDGF